MPMCRMHDVARLSERPLTIQPCTACGAETKFKWRCPACHAPVIYVAPAKRELEQPIKERCHRAVLATGCCGWIHVVDNRNFKHTGLGNGCSDTIYVVPPHGRFLAIEIKRPGYSPSDVTPAQRAFLRAVRHFGGVSGIATCESEALALVAEAQQCVRPDVDHER